LGLLHDELALARRARRLVTFGLGALWTLDGLLQLQPQMFTQGLAVNVVANALMSLPSPLYYASLKFAVGPFLRNVEFLNAGVAALQLAIGLSLLVGPCGARRLALAASVAWGLAVWVFGEGMGGVLGPTMTGGVFPGTPSIFSGFPGAALIYVLIALFLLLPESRWRLSGRLSLVRDAPAALFLVSAAVQAAPLMWTTYGQASIFASNAGKLPQLAGPLLLPLSAFTAAHPAPSNGLELAACALSALGMFSLRRWGYLLALGLLAFIWCIPLALAGMATGIATDPNTPPDIALLMVPAMLASWDKAAARAGTAR
jgi:hypothetical protein